MRLTLIAAAAAVLLLAGCGGGDGDGEVSAPAATLSPELLALYDYEPGPLDVEEAEVRERDGAVVRDLSYAGPEGRITAYFVTPRATARSPPSSSCTGAPASG